MYLDLRELAEELDAFKGMIVEHVDPEAGHATPADWLDVCPLCGEDDEAGDRYKALKELDSDLGGLEEYARNEPVAIPDFEFEDYAQQLAEDIGAISGDEGWPLSFIDWEGAAEALQQDYQSFTFEGTEYWVRAY